MEVSTRAVLTAVLAAVMAVTSYLVGLPELAGVGEIPAVVAASLLALAIAVGWPVLLNLPNLLGSSVVIALGGLGAVAAVYATAGGPRLRELPLVVALAVLLAFVNELARQDGRTRLLDSVSGTVAGVLVATAAAGWLAAERSVGGTALVVSATAALAVAAAVSAVPLGGWLGALVTTGAGIATGAAVGALMADYPRAVGPLLGFAMGLLVAALHALLDRLPALRRRTAALAVVVLPVALSGVIVYVVGRVLVT